MNSRKWCACGCKRSVADRRKGTKWATPTCRSDWRARQKPVQGGSGGAQVSFKKAIDEVAREIAKFDTVTPRTRATAALLRALPVRQRERLAR